MESSVIVTKSIEFVTMMLAACFEWFSLILEKTGTTKLWIAGVIFCVVMSVIILPLRGGKAVGGDSFAGFLSNKISTGKETARREREKAEREARRRPWLRRY